MYGLGVLLICCLPLLKMHICVLIKLIRDCLPILILLYIMLGYLMLLSDIFITVCLYNAYFFFPLSFQMFFVFMLCLWVIDT